MAQTEIRRGYAIEVFSENDASPQALESIAPESGVAETIVEAREVTGELLIIDGKPVPFSKSTNGYNIYYMPSEKSLLEAARKFVDTQREKAQ